MRNDQPPGIDHGHYSHAKSMMLAGYEDKRILFELADKGVSDEMADRIVKEIKKLRSGIKRRRGVKLLILGGGFIGAALFFSFWSFNSDSPIGYVLWGAGLLGVMVMAKGLTDIVFG